ncbi:MAG: HAD family hydrolase [Candidatus Sericytochromatia bacterium]
MINTAIGYVTARRAVRSVAPEQVLALINRAGLCAEPLDGNGKAHWLNQAHELAADGLRVLALAMDRCADPEYPVDDRLAFVGLVALQDPARADIAEAIVSLRRACIDVVMATGDHPATVLTIARDVGIAATDANVITSQKLSTFSPKLRR